MEQITNLCELKYYLESKYPNVEDMNECFRFIENYCELVDGSESLEYYFDYILPFQLVREWRSVKFTLKNVAKRQKAINDKEAQNIQVRVKGA